MNAPDVWAAIQYAYEHEEVLADAQRRFADLAQTMFLPHAVELSASSAGACVLERWSYLHGKHDIPENYATMLAKMDQGTLAGARIATLFAAGYEAQCPGSTVWLEQVVADPQSLGPVTLPGHIDILIADTRWKKPMWVVEVKTSFWTGEFSGPPDYHRLQVGIYAVGAASEIPGFSIFTLLPAAQRNAKKGILEPRHFVQKDYEVDDNLRVDVAAEVARLRQAEADEPPRADAREVWRCSSCRYSLCDRNVNPLKVAAVDEVPL